MVARRSPVSPETLNAALARLPHLTPMPVFSLEHLMDGDNWLDEYDDGRPGLELVELEFDEVAHLF